MKQKIHDSSLSPDLLKKIADRYRIGQVLTNFISNAIKYSPRSTDIIIETRIDSKDVTVCVRDHGIGIPEDKQKKIFNRFYRVLDKKRASYPGLGLGLYISHEIIKRQDGTIWFDSIEGKGSTFYFKLPIKHLHYMQRLSISA